MVITDPYFLQGDWIDNFIVVVWIYLLFEPIVSTAPNSLSFAARRSDVTRPSFAVYIPLEAGPGNAAVYRGSYKSSHLATLKGAGESSQLGIPNAKQSRAEHRFIPTSPGNSTPPQRVREDRPPLRSITRTHQTVSHRFVSRLSPLIGFPLFAVLFFIRVAGVLACCRRDATSAGARAC